VDRRRRNFLWLLSALVLLALAGLVQRACGTGVPLAERPAPELPRGMRPAETQRMTQREVLQPTLTGPKPERRRDPVLRALVAPGAGTAVVFEANALRHSPLGQLLLDCLDASMEDVDGGQSPLEQIRALGIDPLKDLDRVAFGDDDLVVLSGDFSRAKWDAMPGLDSPEAYGSASQIRGLQGDADGGQVLATWGNQLAFFAPSREAAIATLDRIEGRSPSGQLLGDDQAYGDMYGVLSGSALQKMFGSDDGPLGAQLRAATRSVELHLDASHDVGLVADMSGDDASQLSDLGKTLGGALAVARAKAVATGDNETAEFLEYAQVVPGQKLSLELAIPLEAVKKRLAFCGRGPRADAGP
jgi:hypothetical protein